MKWRDADVHNIQVSLDYIGNSWLVLKENRGLNYQYVSVMSMVSA